MASRCRVLSNSGTDKEFKRVYENVFKVLGGKMFPTWLGEKILEGKLVGPVKCLRRCIKIMDDSMHRVWYIC